MNSNPCNDYDPADDFGDEVDRAYEDLVDRKRRKLEDEARRSPILSEMSETRKQVVLTRGYVSLSDYLGYREKRHSGSIISAYDRAVQTP